MLGNANQSIGWSPLLQESVPIARPTCVPTACGSSWFTSSSSPTITSGPGTRVGVLGSAPFCMGGMIADVGCALAIWVIWIGCIVAPIAIVPADEPATDG